MTIDLRSFFQIALISVLGFVFYYSGLLFGAMDSSVLYKAVAVIILLLTLPLPILAIHNPKMFKGVHKGTKHLIVLASLGLLFHHALLTFVIVMFTGTSVAF